MKTLTACFFFLKKKSLYTRAENLFSLFVENLRVQKIAVHFGEAVPVLTK